MIDIADVKAFLSAAKTRQWDRDVSVRTLADSGRSKMLSAAETK
jgi:hypothetical protein